MKLNLSLDVPTLSQDERNALSAVIRDAIDQWLFYKANSAVLTDEDKAWLKQAHISA